MNEASVSATHLASKMNAQVRAARDGEALSLGGQGVDVTQATWKSSISSGAIMNEASVSATSRRDFIKAGLLGLGAGAMALSGCQKEDVTSRDELEIIPKQTATYEFSTPLPFSYKTIDEIIELNSTLKKSKVTSFYNCTPETIKTNFNHWIQIPREGGKPSPCKTYDDFKKYVKYAISNGFKFTYLMNSPKPFSERDFLSFKDDFLYLLDYLYKIGVRNIKIGNTQVAQLINDITQGAFILSGSTALEFNSITQYKYLFERYPNFDVIDLPIDQSFNFQFLKGFLRMFPDKKLELMVNDRCIKGCPAWIPHRPEMNFCAAYCPLSQEGNEIISIIMSAFVYPWNLEYYSALGINNFKFVARGNAELRANYNDLTCLRGYLHAVDNGINSLTTKDFLKIFAEKIILPTNPKLVQLKQYLPDIKHFVAHGHECATK
ncbi:twin-arginine translocation signal domain-containing protein, partial [bacterium]|nr:twin-arginine translocation signal domain-containing protein [bacterium]